MSAQSISLTLHETEVSLRATLRSLHDLQQAKSRRVAVQNTKLVLGGLMRLLHPSFTAVQVLLRMLSDMDIISLASTCVAVRRLVYSPLGYRMVRCLRPPVLVLRREQQMPVFTQTALENLCSDRPMKNMDEDDQEAIIQTMKTNLFATKQKIQQMETCNSEYDCRIKALFQQSYVLNNEREEYQRKIQRVRDEIDKLVEMREISSNHVSDLRREQEKLVEERIEKCRGLKIEKEKLEKQKELLIKKIKHQQKEREEGLIYAREVDRILGLFNKLITKK